MSSWESGHPEKRWLAALMAEAGYTGQSRGLVGSQGLPSYSGGVGVP